MCKRRRYIDWSCLRQLQVKAAQPRDKEYMLLDGEGLYLRVRPNGKVWIKQAGREAKLSFGFYLTMSLVVARRKARDEAEKRAGGIDPRVSELCGSVALAS